MKPEEEKIMDEGISERSMMPCRRNSRNGKTK